MLGSSQSCFTHGCLPVSGFSPPSQPTLGTRAALPTGHERNRGPEGMLCLPLTCSPLLPLSPLAKDGRGREQVPRVGAALAIRVAGKDPGSPFNPFHGTFCFSHLREAWLGVGEHVRTVSWTHKGLPTTFSEGVSSSQLASRTKAWQHWPWPPAVHPWRLGCCF